MFIINAFFSICPSDGFNYLVSLPSIIPFDFLAFIFIFIISSRSDACCDACRVVS